MSLLHLVKAGVCDAEKLWTMQLDAFSELLAVYQDYSTSPGAEPLEMVLKRLQMPQTHFYFIEVSGKCVGAVRVVDPDPVCGGKRISPLFILREHRGKGFAQLAILEAEKLHGSHDWHLDTILEEKGNCYLYEKMGYRKTGRYEKINDKMTLVYYEKK